MAYNLMLEFSRPADWLTLEAKTRPFNSQVEYFPIPSEGDQQPDALGISVPLRHANESGWQELRAVLAELESMVEFGVVEMYSGRSVPRQEWNSLRTALML